MIIGYQWLLVVDIRNKMNENIDAGDTLVISSGENILCEYSFYHLFFKISTGFRNSSPKHCQQENIVQH